MVACEHMLTGSSLLAWVFVVLGDSYDLDTHSWNPDGIRVIRQQDFWYVMGMTTWIVLPWICTREVPVDIELVSHLCPQGLVTAQADASASARSRHPRWPLSASGVGCNRDCSDVLVEAP